LATQRPTLHLYWDNQHGLLQETVIMREPVVSESCSENGKYFLGKRPNEFFTTNQLQTRPEDGRGD